MPSSAPSQKDRTKHATVIPDNADTLRGALRAIRFTGPITHVYNPLEYAREGWEQYVGRYARAGVEAVLVGMNPGPWGMAQTGVPFGEVNIVRDWLRIDARIGRPQVEHPKRRVEGLNCKRSEVSGARLWGWARERFGTPEKFFARFFVYNYCPLMFLEESGRNFPPDKLRAGEGEKLFAVCDAALREVVAALRPRYVIGVGGWAEGRVRSALAEEGITNYELQITQNVQDGRGVQGTARAIKERHEATKPRSHEGEERNYAGDRSSTGKILSKRKIDSPTAEAMSHPPLPHGRGSGMPVIGRILHPSPASPAANRGWAKQAEADLKKMGIVV